MTSLNYIDKLLDGAGIVWLPLTEVTRYELPNMCRVTSENFDDVFLTPVLTASKPNMHGHTDESNGIYKASENPVIVFNDWTATNRWIDFDFKTRSKAIRIISSSDDKRFLLRYIFHWMSTVHNDFVGGNNGAQWKQNFCRKKIPIPCPDDPGKSMAKQTEIVRILDGFDKLTAELSTELAARKKQYKYYLDQLLTFNDDYVEWKPVGEIATVSPGSRKIRDAADEGKYPFYVLSKHPRKIENYDFNETAIIAGVGDGGIGTFFHYVTGKYGLHRSAYRIVIHDPKIFSKFLYYFFKRDFHSFVSRTSVHGLVTSRKRTWLEKYLIPIPYPDDSERSMAEQARIIKIIDKFDDLTNSVSEGLPLEIELRRKQYEYYRNVLLKFPKQKKEEKWLKH